MGGSVPVSLTDRSLPAGLHSAAMPIAHTDWIDIHYADHGDASAPPVVLLHGFPDSADTWDGVVRELQPEVQSSKLRLIVPDMRGYGQTRVKQADAGGNTQATMGQDAVDLIDALQLGKAVILGHDWGARAAFAAAALYPDRVRSIVTLASPYVAYEGRKPVPPPQVQAYWYQWYFNTDVGEKGFRSDVVGFCRHLWAAWSPAWDFTDAEFERASRAWHRPEFVDLTLHAYRSRYGNAEVSPRYVRQQATFDRQPKIGVPCWFAAGLADACTLPDSGLGQEAWFTAGYHRHEVPDVGHFVQREAPRVVANLVRQAAGL